MKTLILLFTLSMNAFALTPEQVKAINEQNARAMENIYANGVNHVNTEAPQEVESEVVTNKEFKKIQKEQAKKKEKVPFILNSSEYVKNQTKHLNKQFKVMVIGDTIIAPAGDKKACAFNYIQLTDDSGFEAQTGHGQYYIESLKGVGCSRLIDIHGQDASSVDLIVKFIGLSQSPQDPKKLVPVLEVVRVD